MNNFLIRNIKELIKISNSLDDKGMQKESMYLDSIIRKISADLDDLLGGPNPKVTSLDDSEFNPLSTATEPPLELSFEDEEGEAENLEFGSAEMAKGLPNYQKYESLLSGLRDTLPDMDPSQIEEILLMVADQVSED